MYLYKGTRGNKKGYIFIPKSLPEGGLLVVMLSPYKASKSPSQPGGGLPPSAAGLRWIVTKSVCVNIHMYIYIYICIVYVYMYIYIQQKCMYTGL